MVLETHAGTLGDIRMAVRDVCKKYDGAYWRGLVKATVRARTRRRSFVNVENGIGRLRRVLPRKTNLGEMSDERFTGLLQGYNNTPRKCLGYQSPSEIFWSQVLHFKCESTFPPARERRVFDNGRG